MQSFIEELSWKSSKRHPRVNTWRSDQEGTRPQMQHTNTEEGKRIKRYGKRALQVTLGEVGVSVKLTLIFLELIKLYYFQTHTTTLNYIYSKSFAHSPLPKTATWERYHSHASTMWPCQHQSPSGGHLCTLSQSHYCQPLFALAPYRWVQ